jgi:hypothetical protein
MKADNDQAGIRDENLVVSDHSRSRRSGRFRLSTGFFHGPSGSRYPLLLSSAWAGIVRVALLSARRLDDGHLE